MYNIYYKYVLFFYLFLQLNARLQDFSTDLGSRELKVAVEKFLGIVESYIIPKIESLPILSTKIFFRELIASYARLKMRSFAAIGALLN